jgi:SPP1 family predicted phage head-tail adaptor
MRAGQLTHWITIEKASDAIDDFGVPQPSWTIHADVKAQVVRQSSEEFVKSYGLSAENRVIFRIRYLPEVTTANRVVFGDLRFDIIEVKELGRRKDLELRCVERAGV